MGIGRRKAEEQTDLRQRGGTRRGQVRRAPGKESQRAKNGRGVPCPYGEKAGPQCRLRGEMKCPKCRAEYRRGFTVCADCDVPLVESTELTARSVVDDAPEDWAGRESVAGMPGDPNSDPFCSFWKGTDLRVCTEICAVLDEAEIPHKMIRRQDHLFNWSHHSPYQIGVPASLYEKAELAIKEAFSTDEESGQDVVHLLPPAQEDARAKALRSVWVGNSALDCAALCGALKEAGIYYRVDEQKELAVSRTIDRYQIGVAEKDFEPAVAITGGFHPEGLEEEKEEDVSADEIPAPQEQGEPGSDWVEGSKRIRRREWYPEDATSLAWEGDPADWHKAIEMSLLEHDIPMRWEMQDGKAQLFVLPEDEERAKEIVREILEGEPQE